MHRVLLLFIVCSLCIVFPAALQAETDPGKAKDIKTLLRLTQAMNAGLKVAETKVDYLLVYARKAKPYIPAEAFQRLRQEVVVDLEKAMWAEDGLVNELVATWDERFSAREIRQLLEFYQTKVGQKLVAETPYLMRQGKTAGGRWVGKFEPQIADRIRAKLTELEKQTPK